MTKRKPDLVRYVSPFGSPAWMTLEQAEKHLRVDDARWVRWSQTGALTQLLSAEQRAVGPPYIQRGTR